MAPTRRRLISIADAAEQTAVSTRTVRRWIATGRLRGMVRRGELDRIADRHNDGWFEGQCHLVRRRHEARGPQRRDRC